MQIEKLENQLGKHLVSIVETHHPMQILIVVESLDLEVIDLVKSSWKEKQLPLLFSLKELRGAKDVFSVDFLSMQSDYTLLYGTDPFKGLKVLKKDVRHQLEFELRSKLIVLREKYLSGQKPKMLLEFALPTLMPLLRAMLYLHDAPIEKEPADILEKVFKHTKISSPILLDLAQGKKVHEGRIGEIMTALEQLIDYCERL